MGTLWCTGPQAVRSGGCCCGAGRKSPLKPPRCAWASLLLTQECVSLSVSPIDAVVTRKVLSIVSLALQGARPGGVLWGSAVLLYTSGRAVLLNHVF